MDTISAITRWRLRARFSAGDTEASVADTDDAAIVVGSSPSPPEQRQPSISKSTGEEVRMSAPMLAEANESEPPTEGS